MARSDDRNTRNRNIVNEIFTSLLVEEREGTDESKCSINLYDFKHKYFIAVTINAHPSIHKSWH
jgi:hypothetical protein